MSKRNKSYVENIFAFQLKALGLEFEQEYKAIPGRRYRWDFFIKPDLLIEIQGGTWAAGKMAHNSGAGIKRDCEKLNIATMYDYRSLNFTTDMVIDGTALKTVEDVMRSVQDG